MQQWFTFLFVFGFLGFTFSQCFAGWIGWSEKRDANVKLLSQTTTNTLETFEGNQLHHNQALPFILSSAGGVCAAPFGNHAGKKSGVAGVGDLAHFLSLV
jgi:hypothetical protein